MQLITYKVITCGQHGMISGQQAGSLDSASGSHGQCPTHLVGQPPKAPVSPPSRTNSDFEEIQVIHPVPTVPVCPLGSPGAQPHAAGVNTQHALPERRRRAGRPLSGQSATCSDSEHQKRSTVHVLLLAAVPQQVVAHNLFRNSRPRQGVRLFSIIQFSVVHVQETWLLSEFCDKGNMDRALSGGRFHNKDTSKPEWCAPTSCCCIGSMTEEIPHLQALPSMMRCITGMPLSPL